MQLLINGEPCACAEALTIRELLTERGLAGRRVAVEVNLAIVPKSQHDSHRLAPGDRVEIIQALGGG